MIGIIGGTGLDKPELFEQCETKNVKTPYGKTAAPIRIGFLREKKVALVSRHGFEHEFSPTVIPYQANIWALKKLGATNILGATACGSLREKIRPGDFIVPNQLIDFTQNRPQTFGNGNSFDDYTSSGEPFSKTLNRALMQSLQKLGYRHHRNKTLLTIEGPHFSTRAESRLFRQWGADIINMTTSTEAILCREIGMCYSVLAVATDYDSWKKSQKPVINQEVVEGMAKNQQKILEVFRKTIPTITSERPCKEE